MPQRTFREYEKPPSHERMKLTAVNSDVVWWVLLEIMENLRLLLRLLPTHCLRT